MTCTKHSKVNKGSNTISIEGKVTHGVEVEKFKRTLTYPSNLLTESLSSKLHGQTLVLTAQKNPNQRSTDTKSRAEPTLGSSSFVDEFNKRAEDFFGRGVMDGFSANKPAIGIQERSRYEFIITFLGVNLKLYLNLQKVAVLLTKPSSCP